jgi:hypothetical protein
MRLHRQRRKHASIATRSTCRRRGSNTLEVRGYLNPDRRGDRADECDAIEMFVTDTLAASPR